MRNERAAVGTAVSLGLEKGELIEGRRTNLWDEGRTGQDLIQHHSPFLVCAKAADKVLPSCQYTNHG